MKECVNQRILGVKPYIPGKPIDEVKRELGLKNVIKLASNENPYGPSPKVLNAIAHASKTLNRYPDGDCYYLRSALAKRLKVKPSELIFGNGSDEIINFACRVFINPGDEVIIAKPSFLIYDIASRIAGAVVKEVPLKKFHYDLEGIKKAVTEKTKIIFIGNPDNPAGTYLTHGQIKDFIQNLSSEILIFVDEAYYEYVLAKDYANALELLKSHKNLVVTRTFSKMYGLAGLRIGYGIGNEEVIDLLNRVREPFNVNSLAQVAAIACLKEGAYYKKLAKKIEQQRQFLYKNFKRLGINFEESCTNFVLIRVSSASAIARKLLKKGVIIRDMSFWGLNDYIRVTIGTEQENKKLLSVLKGVL